MEVIDAKIRRDVNIPHNEVVEVLALHFTATNMEAETGVRSPGAYNLLVLVVVKPVFHFDALFMEGVIDVSSPSVTSLLYTVVVAPA